MSKIVYVKVFVFFMSVSTFFPAFSKPPTDTPRINAAHIEKNQNEKVNVNKAEASAIASQVKGIGKKRAEAIVKYRETHGNFDDLRALSEVKGISKRFVAKNWESLDAHFSLK